ncbi:[FeFe] hydrogenase H-cluster maturation GTPase HydF [Clostridium thermosuccinogenes]|uniref:[FeFe] hydrogenase H-cluster maturation GTPase HydF n=1 Tax=Clostridium thermosuccinogenes TaxID=84032 RepID=A0A2K2FI10_9CLOT|nr:[FeFe] hydrogenase H-cluster maturation GTPase HydF [Pseudoclostridium thermosuccinogenes]AUS95609.1 [FeFe] hydrogenase H-cluster maturation GTPase HydF [Pseudoclostridium thermosuccinogenes]PNT98425.1 [FeFe] hydrogenase H-cluster maturation GTPase HydF [Pseudoclostridium thermosuccinogenes]PNU00493.1 [FeFe] hydrogenase H-cluster maturation GTPase HydF [Pseudoclostridium thermosuccinogenes]
MSLIDTPRANRLHIGIFGKRNSGKSSLLNALTGQDIALVSDVAGTTTDPVYKAMEIYGIGPCVFIDTAGFDDVGELGKMRVEKTKMAAEKTDIALVVFSGDDLDEEKKWIDMLKSRGTPVVLVLNKVDILAGAEEIAEKIEKEYGLKPILVSTREKVGIEKVRAAIIELLPEGYEVKSITGRLAGEGDLVLLVMPQDIQAPKGRLILPQMQTLRDLLDKKCVVVSATTDMLDQALKGLVKPPELIITDSQVFKTVYDKKPEESKLTSFSILFANYKGDLDYYVKSVEAIDNLTEDSKVLIAEACTHVPLEEDIGREKLPRMLRKRIGEKLTVEVVSGQDFPEDLSGYDLVIQCGACMFNRKHVLSRIERARSQGVPMSNYGVVIAYLTGILDKIDVQI